MEISVFGGNPNDTPTPTPTPPPTPPPSDSTLNIATTGDNCCSQAQSTLDNIVQKTPEVVLALGDLSQKYSPVG